MFAIRGIFVSFSVFFLLHSALSVAVSCFRSPIRGQQYSQRRYADLLFALRMAPFAVAFGVTLILTLPSFLLLEPHAAKEATGTMALVFGAGGIALMVAGIWSAAGAWVRASRMIARWSREGSSICAFLIHTKKSVSVVRTSAVAPPLTAAGILRPSVWLSRAAECVLTDRELETALKHEGFHVSRRDNLKKLMMRGVAFPGMRPLESAWREATEMAADDAAVSSVSEALDLAAALIKLSQMSSLEPTAELTMALVHSPASSVNVRVERLIGWEERQQRSTSLLSFRSALCAATVAVSALAMTYTGLLVRMHAATEWLVR